MGQILTMPIDWDHFNLLVDLRNSGQAQESIVELEKIRFNESDPAISVVILMEVVNGLRALKRYSDARGKLNEAGGLIGHNHELYPRICFLDALIEADEKQWNKVLSKLETLSVQHFSVFQSEDHRDLSEEIQ